MRTVMRKPFLISALAALGGVFLWAGIASADVTSDRSSAILVYPKLIYSSAEDDILSAPGEVIDTTMQLTNTSNEEIALRCFYVNANSHCSNEEDRVCNAHADCQVAGAGGFCVPGWIEIDFELTLSPYQPLVWSLGDGLTNFPCTAGAPCSIAGNNYVNTGIIPPANEDPFLGELKCIQVGENNEPIDRNDIKGEATIITVRPDPVGAQQSLDARGYNAVGIQAIPGANDGDNTLRIGEEYNGCPSYLILDHYFDDAVEPIDGAYVKTHLTLVPCSQNFELQTTFDTTLQLLVYNEFEQRFSSSVSLNCFKEYELCHLGTGRDRPFTGLDSVDPAYESCQRSVFSAFVSGTLTGQTRIRSVDDGSEDRGNGVIGVAEEFHRADPGSLRDVVSTAAFNIHQSGTRETPDVIQIP
jgi:hypothetical protein